MLEVFKNLWETSGIATMTWQSGAMIIISFLLIYLAIKKEYEPLLLLPIAFGMLLTNLPWPGGGIFHPEWFNGEINWAAIGGQAAGEPDPGLFDFLYIGVKMDIFPCLIFLAVGAMTDFGPLISRPSSFFMGAGAQFGISFAFIVATLLGFDPQAAASIGIIGGADGPTAIYLTSKLAPELLGAIAIAAYSYMALIPLIQPPFMKLLTTKKMRQVKMEQSRPVSKVEKICFPVIVSVVCILILPSVAPLLGCLMLGNLFRESGVTERLSDTAQNAMCNIVTIFLGTSVGATAVGSNFLKVETLKIILLGLIAFMTATIGGLLIGDLMYFLSKGKINPLIGSAGVSAVPMAARVSNKEGQKENPSNFLLMHAMGPNVAGVIGSAVAAGVLLSLFS
ncbi:MAG: sodium ion-translocating decarboxylase subunit beta [Saccharofermentans sp.]|jgi:oxaloacetate decarboxylase beta subunit|nr:sodium ion-translocating decarboxylase subunit beta [Mageeibacillus sp.]MCI1275014.1 sodium ion-translocating decarboxylase subunit beta [Saccharofermentans sp.]